MSERTTGPVPAEERGLIPHEELREHIFQQAWQSHLAEHRLLKHMQRVWHLYLTEHGPLFRIKISFSRQKELNEHFQKAWVSHLEQALAEERQTLGLRAEERQYLARAFIPEEAEASSLLEHVERGLTALEQRTDRLMHRYGL